MSWIFDTKWKKARRDEESEIFPLKDQELLNIDPSLIKKNLIMVVVGSVFAILLGSYMISLNPPNGAGWLLIMIGISAEILVVLTNHNKLEELEKRVSDLEEK